MPGRDYLTIGEVVERLEPRYGDLSISKVRFLEEEGLISPQRTAGGYRKFSATDVERIEGILRLQKDYFMPLAVIREKLAEADRGHVPEELARAGDLPGLIGGASEEHPIPYATAASTLGVPDSFLRELLDYGLIATSVGEEGPELAAADVRIARIAWDLRRFGVEPRHLRMYVNSADREAALFGQILTPAFRQKSPDSKQRLADTLGDITRTTADLKRELLERAVERQFDGQL
jgi:DNA-binding transcriptional MerR regulator